MPTPSDDAAPYRRATMADVARRAGVSRTLASLVFAGKPGASESSRARVLQAADDLAYQPDSAARLLARSRSRTIGVVTDVQQPFQSDMIGSVYNAAETAGYEVLLSASAPTRNERRAVEALLGHRCEGLILLSPLSESAYLRTLPARAVVTIVGRRVTGADFNSVRSADRTGIRMSVDYLVALGHTDIAHVDGGSNSVSADRRRAYAADMRGHGLGEKIRILSGAHDEAAGAAAATKMLDEKSIPTAVLAGNDRSAIGMMDVFTTAGVSIPGDISIIGYDDAPLARLARIDLTTVRQDSGELARQAVQLTVSRLDDSAGASREVVIEPELVVRGTSAPPRTIG